MKLYSIRNWQEIFENNETRKLKNLRWVATPNKHDGIEFRRLMRQKNGAQLFAAWNLIIQVASKTQPKERRGYLERDGIPLSPEALGDATGMSGDLFKQALDYFSNHGNTWIEATNIESPDTSGNNPEASGTSPTEWNGMDGREGRNGKDNNGTFVPSTFNAFDICKNEDEKKLMKFLLELFDRRDTTPWDDKMIKRFHEIDWSDSDTESIRWMHKEIKHPYKIKTLKTLLNNFQDEVEKANNYKLEKNYGIPKN